MILITGATGNFGFNLAKKLQEKHISFRAAAQSILEVKEKLGNQVDAIAFDWNEPETFNNLLKDISIVYLISPPFTSNFDVLAEPFITKAKKHNVKHIVLTTSLSSENNSNSIFSKIEELVKNSGINFTIIRPSFLVQNFVNYDLQSVKGGALFMPSGNGKTSYIDVRDVALASSIILENSNEHIGKTYSLTGKEALTHDQMAEILGEVLGKTVINVDPTVDEYKKAFEGYNVPDFIYNFMSMLYTEVSESKWEKISDDFKNLTAKSQKTFKEFAIENIEVFR